MGESPVLTIRIYSFGFKYSGPPEDKSGHGGGFQFDCRALPNPYWDDSLRGFSGLQTPIADFMARHEEVGDFFQHALALVLHAASAYNGRGYGHLMVSFGCTGGRHRSVYLADLAAQRLQAEGFATEVVHVDIDRHSGKADP